MISIIRKLTIFSSLFMLAMIFYQLEYVDHSEHWKNYKKPQLASYRSLEEDQTILKELDRQTNFNTHKVLDPSFFLKPNIFEPVI